MFLVYVVERFLLNGSDVEEERSARKARALAKKERRISIGFIRRRPIEVETPSQPTARLPQNPAMLVHQNSTGSMNAAPNMSPMTSMMVARRQSQEEGKMSQSVQDMLNAMKAEEHVSMEEMEEHITNLFMAVG